MDINRKVAILTGASTGLGTAVARALVERGAEVYGLARSEDKLRRLKESLGDAFRPVIMDITDQKGLDVWVEATFSKNKAPDILINNAGVGSFGKVDEMETSEWLNMVNTNLNGLYFITSKISALMKRNGQSAHIINIGSILGTLGRSEGAAYCATKFGTRGFSEALFKELRFYDIKVTCLNPGSIDTGFFKSSGIEPHDNMLQPTDLADTVIHVLQTPDNMLINELMVRPLNPKRPKNN